MKRVFIFILLGFYFLGCKKKTDVTPCASPDFSFEVRDTKVVLTANSNYSSYEVEYGPAGFAHGSGTVKTISGLTNEITDLAYGNYEIYFRGYCPNKVFSDWTAPKAFTIDGSTSSCAKPENLSVDHYSIYDRFSWYAYADYYDVEYGPTGFQIGTGRQIRTNNTYTADAVLTAGTTYDFYVRCNCGGSAFSGWQGPRSFLANFNQNQGTSNCSAPTTLYAYKINSQEINYSFVGQGSVSYEIAFSTSQSINTGNILPINSTSGTVGGSFNASNYYFWVRGKCSDGSFTSWSKSLVE